MVLAATKAITCVVAAAGTLIVADLSQTINGVGDVAPAEATPCTNGRDGVGS
jgi:hypothetical protein